ncbi:class F sortase [Curtobacterium sp. S6]|uniref:class F sortase n=1 Tax=Curtobacterium sp. S6 TaxID=1479623 RepID=UPI0004AAF561|nr:class F sortase [Curtobacterium sp. S6]
MRTRRRDRFRRIAGATSLVAGAILLLLTLLAARDAAGSWRFYLNDPTLLAAQRLRSDEGHDLLARGETMTSIDLTSGGQYAPRPARQFRHATCDAATVPHDQETSPPRASSWRAPSIHAESVVRSTTVRQDGVIPLVDAPDGVWDDATGPIGSEAGATLLAGHVNYPDGRLSPWGKLHRIRECSRITATDPAGKPHAYLVTDLYIVPQRELPDHPELTDRAGPPRLYLVTCAGPETPGVSPGLFQYQDNLIVVAQPAPQPNAPRAEGSI